jgi:hypothetical protein
MFGEDASSVFVIAATAIGRAVSTVVQGPGHDGSASFGVGL